MRHKFSLLKQAIFYLLFLCLPVLLFSQQQAPSIQQPDSIGSIHLAKYDSSIKKILAENLLLNTSGKANAVHAIERKQSYQDFLFYLLLFILAILAFFRFFYSRYFNTLFRVFFNTTLRQSQLTDQLLQAKLASLLFNLFFIASAGLYVFFLLRHFKWVSDARIFYVIFSCVISIAGIYSIKYLTLKFTAWLTGYKEAVNTYVFVIFLINKILGILLVPFIFLIAFSDLIVRDTAILVSLLLIGLMFLLRFFRSYGLLQNQLKVSRLHFFMYIAGIEIVPLLLIYKGLVILLNKNL